MGDRPWKEDTAPKSPVIKTRKYRLHPTKEQRATLKLWSDATRWIYNRVVKRLNRRPKGTKVTLALLREWASTVSTAWKNPSGSVPPRFWPVPYHIRDSPIRDVAAACAALKAKEKTLHRELKFHRRKDYTSSFTVGKKELNCSSETAAVWPRLFGTILNRSMMRTERGKTLPLVFQHDCRLVHERQTGFYYLCVPMDKKMLMAAVANAAEIKAHRETVIRGGLTWIDYHNAVPTPILIEPPKEKKEETCRVRRNRMVAIDPGIRTFGTCYDPDGVVTEWAAGNSHLALLARLERKASRIQERAKSIGGRRKRRLTAAASRIRKRSRDLVNELHRKFARWLCSEHDLILLPKFNTQPIVRKRAAIVPSTVSPGDKKKGKWIRKIGRKTAGSAMRLAHYRFRTFLLHKAAEMGARVVLCDERYTSKTCGSCGTLNETLGASKTFSCAHCGYVADRDHNAARNVLLRYLELNEVTLEDYEIEPASAMATIRSKRPAGRFMPS